MDFHRARQRSHASCETRSNCIFLTLLVSLCLLACSRGLQYYLDKGNRFFAEAKYGEAALNYRNGLKKDANSAEAHYRLGLAESKQGHFRGAYDEWRRAVELAPNRDDIRVDLADLALVSYSHDPKKPKILYDLVVDTAEYLLRRDATSFHGMRLRADALVLDGKLEDAIAVFRRANSVKPLEPLVIFPMVQVLMKLNQ